MRKSARPSRALQIILANLLDRAQASPGDTATTRLTDNLKLDIMIKSDSVLLMISRSTSYPSVVEWYGIIRHWPYPVDARPEAVHLYGRHYLRATLRLTDRTLEAGS